MSAPTADAAANNVNETPAWVADAACRGVDPDIFFADQWGSTLDAARAKAVCGGCPVREPCLAYALALPEIHGIWGGLSPIERRAERRQRNVVARRVHPDTCGCPACRFKKRWVTS